LPGERFFFFAGAGDADDGDRNFLGVEDLPNHI
jgi:hypothetical protein